MIYIILLFPPKRTHNKICDLTVRYWINVKLYLLQHSYLTMSRNNVWVNHIYQTSLGVTTQYEVSEKAETGAEGCALLWKDSGVQAWNIFLSGETVDYCIFTVQHLSFFSLIVIWRHCSGEVSYLYHGNYVVSRRHGRDSHLMTSKPSKQLLQSWLQFNQFIYVHRLESRQLFAEAVTHETTTLLSYINYFGGNVAGNEKI